MQKVCEIHPRNWTEAPFSGVLANNLGSSDIGASYSDFEEAVMDRSKRESCASILGNTDIELMSDKFKERVQYSICQLEGEDIPTTQLFKNIDRIGKLRKQLNDDSDRRRGMDSQAAKVLAIRFDYSSPTVQNHHNSIIRPFGSSFFLALKELMKVQTMMYFGDAHLRKDEANRRISMIGWAETTEDLLLLISQFQHVFRLSKQWLTRVDISGNEELYDDAVPNIGTKEMIRLFLQRIDSKSQQLTVYRTMITDCMNKGFTFAL